MKKILVITAVLALTLVPLSLGAQTAENAEFQLLSFDIGYAPGWNLSGSSYITPSLFGLNIRIADKLSAGFKTFNEGGTTDSFLVVKYSFLPQIRAAVGFGAQDVGGTPTPATSIGVEVIPFSRSVGGVAVTEFKLAVEYDAPFTDVTKGRILFALAFGIGF